MSSFHAVFVVEPNKDVKDNKYRTNKKLYNIHNKHKEKYITIKNMQSTTYSKYCIQVLVI